MSAFSTSPRPRIVNGVLISGCNDKKRCNGLQGTNSREDFYRTIVEMPSPTPETDIPPAELVSVECVSPQENINRPAHFDQERRHITGNSEIYSVHCDRRQGFEPQECEQQTPPFCTHSNSHICSEVGELDMGQDRMDSHPCSEGKHLVHRDKWESGDHHRSIIDDSSAPPEEDRHYHPDNFCYNSPTSLDKNKPKYLHKGGSPQDDRRDSTLEEYQDHTHCHTCSHTHDAFLTENKPLLRTPKSPRLHEQAIGSSHEHTNNCIGLMNPEDSCNPQNVFRRPSSKGKSRTMQYEKPEDLIYLHTSTPEYLHTPQGCRPQDKQSEHNQTTAREEFNVTEDDLEEFTGYPPQRRTIKQYNMATEDKNVSSHGNLNAEVPRNEKPECRRFIRRKGEISNITDREAKSVAELLNHPVMDAHLVESEILAPQCSPPRRTLNPEDALGYPPQLTSLRKSKYSAHRACENDSQDTEKLCNYDTQKRQVSRNYEHSNDSWTRAEGDHEHVYVGQRKNVRREDNYEDRHKYCGAYNKHDLNHPHMTENEREEAIPHGTAQHTACVNQEQSNKNICTQCSPRICHPKAQEHYHSHHCSHTPDEEIHHSVKKVPQETKCHAPASCEGRESHSHHRDEIINAVNSRRKNKELYGGDTKNSCRPDSAHYEHEYCRKENENIIRSPECQINDNPIAFEHSDGYIDKTDSPEDGHTLQDNAPHDELQAREQEKCFTQSTNMPSRSYKHCESEHVRDNPHQRVSELHSKETEVIGEYSASSPWVVSDFDSNFVPRHTGRPVEGALRPSSITKPYRRKNGLEDEDFEIANAENGDISFEENNKVDTKKHKIMQIIQNARQNATSQSKCETLSKLNNAHSMTGASEERKHPSNLNLKTRIPKQKANMTQTSDKNNTEVGCLQQRSKRTTSQKF